MRSQLHPNAVYVLKMNNKTISQADGNAVISYIYWYLLVFVIGSVLLVITGVDLISSTSGVATAMGGIGPGFGTIGPVSNFAHLPALSKTILSLAMLLGRLEIYPLVLLLSMSFWKK